MLLNFKEFVTGQKRPTSRTRLLQYWQTLRPDTPLLVTPIPVNHQGSTRDDDGIRLTGSPQFIAATIGRLKELLSYENENTKIEITYKQAQAQDGNMSRPSYIMYIQVRERPKHAPRPHKVEPIKPAKPSTV